MTARKLLLTWAGLMALLGVEWAASLIPGSPSLRPLLLIPAVLMVVLVAVVFMEIGRAPSIAWLFVAAGLLWLAVLLGLGCLDPMTRINYFVAH